MSRQTNIKIRRGTSSAWSSSNPILDFGEPGWDSSKNILKIGNGNDNWNDLKNINPDFNSYTTTIGNNYQSLFTINHNLNATIDCFVNVRNNLGEYVYPDIKYIDENNISLEFASPPSTNEYTVTITGVISL